MKLFGEEKTLFLLSSQHISYENFKDALVYDKKSTITLKEVKLDIRTNEITKMKELEVKGNNDGLIVSRGMTSSRGI